MALTPAVTYWDRFAEAYANLGEPLRPSGEEIRLMEGVIRDWTTDRGIDSPRMLLLGCTPGIATMQLPAANSMIALDSSFAMAKSVWPGNVAGQRSIVCGDWLAPPLRAASCDIVAGDGSINCVAYPSGFRALAEAAAGLLGRPGLLVLRCYLQSVPRESAEQLLVEALNGHLGSFHDFKLRLLMALQENVREGVAVRDAYQWVIRNVDLASLSRCTGWDEAAIETIHYYNGSSTVYAFPTLEELRTAWSPRFEELSALTSGHGIGSRCPILVFQARPSCAAL